MIMPVTTMKFTKVGGEYVSGDYAISKKESRWVIRYDGKDLMTFRVNTLKDAKAHCERHTQGLANMRIVHAAELAKEAARIEAIRKATASDTYDPACGLLWSEWAEAKVGVSAKQLRIEMDKANALDRLNTALDDLDGTGLEDSEAYEIFSRLLTTQTNDAEAWLRKAASEYNLVISEAETTPTN